MPKFACENCSVTAEWDHLAFYRKQTCEVGNTIPLQALKEYKARRRSMDRHNALASNAKRHIFQWPDDQKVREEMSKPRMERVLPPFSCKNCPKHTPWIKFVSAMRQECDMSKSVTVAKSPRAAKRKQPAPSKRKRHPGAILAGKVKKSMLKRSSSHKDVKQQPKAKGVISNSTVALPPQSPSGVHMNAMPLRGLFEGRPPDVTPLTTGSPQWN